MKLINRYILISIVALLSVAIEPSQAKIALFGDNYPYGVIADGDFNDSWVDFRAGKHPEHWKIYRGTAESGVVANTQMMGLCYGTMFGSNPLTTAVSKPLSFNPRYQTPKAGDQLHWEFAADLEYRSNGTLSFSMLFGKQQRMLAERVELTGSDMQCEYFSGVYTLTEADAKAGLPQLQFEFFSGDAIMVSVDYINVWIEDEATTPPALEGAAMADGSNAIELTWSDDKASQDALYKIYRAEINPQSRRDRVTFKVVGESKEMRFVDSKIISGRPYTYAVTRAGDDAKGIVESSGSNRLTISTKDCVAPAAPAGITVTIHDSEVELRWAKNKENDVASYSVERICGATGKRKMLIERSPRNFFEDILAPKGVVNKYVIYAHDFSGNRSDSSQSVEAQVKVVEGAAFSDLIMPAPLRGELRSDVWGAEGVLPRDINNGIEAPEWSYWGGRPVEEGGKYHMLVTRWPETALKGHWEWSKSTISQVISDDPIGPYRVVKDIAYDYRNGLGHNPDIILLKDGTYALYSLIDWKPMIFTAPSMTGPWKREGVIEIDPSWAEKKFESVAKDKRTYQYERNLSGVQIEDGSFIIVSKFGAMMKSTKGILGPYKLLTPTIQHNETIPMRYRRSNYEDPVMWRDSVQYHLLINAFLDKRAIYLRSADGINWIYEPGLAYTTDFTTYENGAVNKWDKLERPHVLQDEYGRATVLSLAAIDVDKALDYGSDNHSSKNLMIPLRPHTLLTLLNKGGVKTSTKEIKLLIRSEKGFNAAKDVDVKSLRFGSASKVNFGEGAKAISSRVVGENLEVTFDGSQSGVTADDFALKMIGRRVDGELMVGYTKTK